MADTALSVARSVLGSAIGKAATAAAQEMSLLMGVQKEIWFMKDELKTMQAFLIAAEAMKKKKPLIKVWGEQVRSLSYDIEDCLDEFMVHVESQSLSQKFVKLKDRHRIAVQIRNLKSRVEEVSNRNTRYNLIQMEESKVEDAHSYLEDVRIHTANSDQELVGTSTFEKELFDMVNDGQDRVICVVGMGGLGKTTLVRKIYESKEGIENKFAYRSWIIVSQLLNRIDVMKYIIRQLFGDESLKTCLKTLDGMTSVHVHVEHLRKYLAEQLKEKSCFIVLDDVWDTDAWIWIRDICLPSINHKGSRIIITTRDASVARACTTKSDIEPSILELKPLERKDSINLLLKKMRKSEQDLRNDKQLNSIVTDLVKKCGGLPLAILTIGAMFASHHQSEWDNLYAQLPAELENNLRLEAIRSMVTLSYNHLPSHLKPCFLYLSIFPEDFEIKRKRLVGRWIAEGLIRDKVGMNLEDVGNCCFNELINRSMIQPSKVNFEGVVKSCRIHDIMRDIIVSLSKSEGFVYTSGDNVDGIVEDNFRHVAYYVKRSCAMEGMDWSRVRSVTIFGERPAEESFSLCSPRLRMLRTLDLENVQFGVTQNDIRSIGLLRHLKYVSISFDKGYSTIYAIPRCIGKLQGLQALEVTSTYISALPTEICKLKSLRTLNFRSKIYYQYFDPNEPVDCLMHSLCLPIIFTPFVDYEVRNERIAELHMAYSSGWSRSGCVKIPRGIGNLKKLQTLGDVDIKRTSREAIEEIGKLSQLRKLRVSARGATEKKCMALCRAIEKLSSLCSLRIEDDVVEWLDSFSSPLLLRKLCLLGRIGDKVDWFGNLKQLVKLRLYWSFLKEGKAVEILGELPNLLLLDLRGDAYVSEKLVLGKGFQNLKELRLVGISPKLEQIVFEQGVSPKLETVAIAHSRLQVGIIGIKHLPKVKKISLQHVTVGNLGTLQEEVKNHDNKPVLQLLGVTEPPHLRGGSISGIFLG